MSTSSTEDRLRIHTQDLLRIRIGESDVRLPKGKTVKQWQPYDWDTCQPGVCLSFDQTLTKTGWSLVRVKEDHEVNLMAGGLLKPVCDPEIVTRGGFWHTYEKARLMRGAIRRVLAQTFFTDLPPHVVVEMPAVQGHRIESALIAGLLVVEEVAEDWPLDVHPVMISALAARARFLPKEQREKRDVTAYVNGLLPDHEEATAWNQDVHDSVLNALYYLSTGAS